MSLARIRAHVDQWGGLNADDARTLLDIATGVGVAQEYVITTRAYPTPPQNPEDVGASPPFTGPGAYEAATHPESGVWRDGGEQLWVRDVTAWREVAL